MHPTLDLLGALTLPTYGVCLAIGFLAGLAAVWHLAPHTGIDRQAAVELASALVLGGVLGSRLAFALLQWRPLLAGDWGVLAPWRAGHVFYGGLLGGLVVLLAYRRRLETSLGELGDLLIPGVSLAHVFGRLGCLAAGCCWGKPTGGSWGLVFPADSACQLPGRPLHPVQLYEAVGESVIFAVLLAARGHRPFAGRLLWFYFGLYSALRLITETVRGDAIPLRGLGGLTAFQVIAAGVLVLSALAWGRSLGAARRLVARRPRPG